MKNYIALLRGINVSGQKKIQMVDLRKMLEKLSFKGVSTYIQSGNIVFSSNEIEPYVLEKRLKTAIQDTFGYEVPVLVRSKNDFEHILNQNPYTDLEMLESKQVYFVLLKTVPNSKLIQEFQKLTFENEDFFITEDCVYLYCQSGYGKAKLNNNLIEKKLKVEATTRNYKTMAKLLEMAE